MGGINFPALPKITLKEPYKKRPLNEHALLSKGALKIPGAGSLMKNVISHPASSIMSQHISNGYFK